MRITLDEYFMILTKIVSVRSTCNSRHNGCVIIKDKQILSTGYNGAIPGCKHCSEYYMQHSPSLSSYPPMMKSIPFCVRRNMNVPDTDKQNFCVASHAEANAVAQAAKKGISIDNSIAYCTLSPCYNCLKIMAVAGVKKIVYEYEYESNNNKRDQYWKNQILNSGIELEVLKVGPDVIATVFNSLQYPTARRLLIATE